MMNKILFVFLLLFCVCKESKKDEKFFILSVGDLQMYTKPELGQKEIAVCPKGEVVEKFEEVVFRNESHGNFEIFDKINCRGKEGFVSFEVTKIKMHAEKGFLVNNKQYIYDYFEFSEIITGRYSNRNGMIEFFGNIDASRENPRLLLTNVVVNPMYGELLNLVKVKEKQYLLFNYNNIILVSKEGEGVYIEVIRGNDDFQTLDKKKFTKTYPPHYHVESEVNVLLKESESKQ